MSKRKEYLLRIDFRLFNELGKIAEKEDKPVLQVIIEACQEKVDTEKEKEENDDILKDLKNFGK